MRFDDLQTDAGALDEIGVRLARLRVDRSLTQQQLADEAGVSKRTVERAEAGASISLAHFIRLLRALGGLGGLDALLPPPGPRPVEVMENDGRPRRRVRASEPEGEGPTWSWGEES